MACKCALLCYINCTDQPDKIMQKPTIDQLAAIFKCTPDQVRAQFARNAEATQKDADKARATGKKIRKYTADELQGHADELRARSLEK